MKEEIRKIVYLSGLEEVKKDDFKKLKKWKEDGYQKNTF